MNQFFFLQPQSVLEQCPAGHKGLATTTAMSESDDEHHGLEVSNMEHLEEEPQAHVPYPFMVEPELVEVYESSPSAATGAPKKEHPKQDDNVSYYF